MVTICSICMMGITDQVTMTTALRTVSVALAMSVAVVDNETEFAMLKTFVVTRAVSQIITHKPHVYPMLDFVCVFICGHLIADCLFWLAILLLSLFKLLKSALYSYVTNPALSKTIIDISVFLYCIYTASQWIHFLKKRQDAHFASKKKQKKTLTFLSYVWLGIKTESLEDSK